MKLFIIIAVLLNIILISSYGAALASSNSLDVDTAPVDIESIPLQGIYSPGMLGTGIYSQSGILEHVLPQGPVLNSGYVLGVAYDPDSNTYWHIDGGFSPSKIYEQTPDGTVITSGEVPLDARVIVYRPEDRNIYIRSYYSGLYRLNQPFDGTVTRVHRNIFQNMQSGIAFANGGNIFEVYNGTVYEYDFNTGSLLRSFSLDPLYPSGSTYPYNCQIASDGIFLYFLSNPDEIYLYDINGSPLCKYGLNHSSFESFKAPFSLSYTNDRLYVLDDTEDLIYGYWLPLVVIHSPEAVTNDSTPLLNATFFQTVPLAWYALDGNNGTNQTDVDHLNVTLQHLTDGSHNVTAYGKASERNLWVKTVDFFVDTIAPQLSIDPVPSPGSPRVLINGTFVEEGTGIASIVVNGISAAVNEKENLYSVAGLPLVDGENIITVIATDRIGNIGTAELNITVDAIPPVLNIIKPIRDRTWFIDNIVTGTVWDANLSSVTLAVTNETGDVVSRYELNILPGNRFRERVEYYPEQNNTLEFIAYDSVGNINISRKILYVENNTIQKTIPSINENEAVKIDAINETGTSIEFVPDVNLTDVTFTIAAITNKTAIESLNTSSSELGEIALGKMVDINATGNLKGPEESRVRYALISLFYSKDDLDLNGDGEIGPGDIDESSLSIYRYNETAGTWTKLLKGSPDWVLDAGRSPITGDGQGSVWVKVKYLGCYSLTGSLIKEPVPKDPVPSEPEKHNGGPGFGHAVIINRIDTSDIADQDAITAEGQLSSLEITPKENEIPENKTLGEEASDKKTNKTPVEEPESSPGFESIFGTAGLALSAFYLRRQMF